jgi:hypothetical protein
MGEPNVDRLLSGLTVTQLRRWKAYYTLEPFGNWPVIWAACRICSAVCNIAYQVFGSKKVTTVSDFWPDFERSPFEKQLPKQKQQVGGQLADLFKGIGAKRKRKDKK